MLRFVVKHAVLPVEILRGAVQQNDKKKKTLHVVNVRAP